MKNVLCYFKSLFLSFCIISTAVSFFSCENFLSGGEFKEQLEKDIAYAQAKNISVMIQSDEGTGTTFPSGLYTAKEGYPFEISFSEDSKYSFIKWKAVSKTNPSKKVYGVLFDDATSLKTNVKIVKESSDIRIVPECIERIYVEEASPSYSPNGVSRDRSITVQFSKNPSPESFIFKEEEIPSDASEIKKNILIDSESGEKTEEIWAYILDGQTYLKNISITNADGISIAGNFSKPLLDNKILTIPVDKSNPIQLESGSVYKTIVVKISKSVFDSDMVMMNSEKEWRYQITEATDEKALVNISSNLSEGNVNISGTRDYSIGQKINLSFTENSDYQFLYWDYDSSYVSVSEKNEKNTSLTILEKTSGDLPTQVKAVCARRLGVDSFSPSDNSTVSKDSSIIIVFNHDLPLSQEDLSQFENIQINIGGTSVKSSFIRNEISPETKNTISFRADKSNLIDVSSGQTKTISVSIPADFYYKLEDGTKVYFGGSGSSFTYKIDSTTLDKAEIFFCASPDSGSVTPDDQGAKFYSIGEEVPVSFSMNEGWIFNGWTVTGSDENLNEKILIADKNALSTKITVYDAVNVTVKAFASECLKLSSKSPSSPLNPQDCDIVLTFNKALAEECGQISVLNKIRVSSEGNNIDSLYSDRSLSSDRKSIILKNTGILSVPRGYTKLVTVSIPEDFYYSDGDLQVFFAGEVFSFNVDYTTNAKAKVLYSVINGETDSVFNPSNSAGTITLEGSQNSLSYAEYNVGEEVNLSINLNEGYQFYGWKITGSDGNDIPESDLSVITSRSSGNIVQLLIKKAREDLNVKAIVYKRPSLSLSSVSPYDSGTFQDFAKNTPIILTFEHAIEDTTKDEIQISYSVSNFTKNSYFQTSISEDKKTVTLTPVKMLPFNSSIETVIVTVPHEKIYYLASDGKTKILLSDKDFSWSYRVNPSTITKTVLKIDSGDASASYINVNKAVISSGSSQIVNVEQSLDLEYPVQEGYKFLGWKITSSSDLYSVIPEGYVESGTISVIKDDKTYFVLNINEEQPFKAQAFSADAIANGSDGSGLTLYAKDVLIPEVTSVSPDYTSLGSNCDSSVTISFNKEMNRNSIVFGLNGTIQIIDPYNENEHYESYFNNPVWNGNTLTIKADNSIRSILQNENDMKNLKVLLDSSRIMDMEGNFLEEDFSWIYKINYGMETDPPSVTMNLYKPVYNLEYETSEKEELSALNISNLDFPYSVNHVKDKVFFSYQAEDNGSGYKKLTVIQKLIKTADGNSITNPQRLSSVYYDQNLEFEVLNLTCSSFDGIVELDFIYEDVAGNRNTKIFYVIKDTSLDSSSVMNPVNVTISSRIPVNGKVTETLNYSLCRDNYYSYYNTICFYSVLWGYSKEDCNQIADTDETEMIYTFERDIKQDVYVKIKAWDQVGNNNEILRVIPKQPEIAQINGSIYGDEFFADVYEINNGEYTNSASYGCKNFYAPVLWRYKATEEDEFGEFENYRYQSLLNLPENIQTNDSQDSFRMYGNRIRDGIYEVYKVYCFIFNESKYYYSALSEPCIYYLNYSPENPAADSVTPEFPESFSVSVDEALPNEAVQSIHVTLPEDFIKTPGYQYGVKWNVNYYNFDFSLKSCLNSQKLYLYAKSSQTGRIYTSSNFVQIQLIDDNIPPVIYPDDLDKGPVPLGMLSWPNKVSPRFYDDEVWLKDANNQPVGGMYYDNDKNAFEVEYYLIKKDSKDTSLPEISREDLNNYSDKKFTSYMNLPQDFFDRRINADRCIFGTGNNFIESYYILILDLRDKNDNRKLFALPYSNITSPEIPAVSEFEAVTINANNGYSFRLDFPICNPSSRYMYGPTRFCYLSEENEWIFLNAVSWGKYTDENTYDSHYFSLIAGMDNFVSLACYYESVSNHACSLYTYVYPSYELMTSQEKSQVCKTKAVISGLAGAYQVFYDAPCFAHTMVFPTDMLSDIDAKVEDVIKTDNSVSEEEALRAVWETKGRETGINLINNDWLIETESTIYSVPLSEIEKGYSYLTVFHFADGTYVMSDVKQR